VLSVGLRRTHLSTYRFGRWFGQSWASTLDQRLEIDEHGVCYAAADGMLLVFPECAHGQTVTPLEGPRLRLERSGATYTLTDHVSRSE
jgi:hypothetical protein